MTTSSKLPEIVAIIGPTASGKSNMAVELAQRLGTEIIGADSRQLYRGMPVITAAPTAEQRATVPHHMVECIDIDCPYSAAKYAQDALPIINDVINRTGTAVVCGGSMLYVRTLVSGIDDIPEITPEVRAEIEQQRMLLGDDAMREKLRLADPAYYAEADISNMRRVVHALEIIRQSGLPYSALRTGQQTSRPFRTLFFTPQTTRQQLFQRINLRVKAMDEAGMENEARSLYPMRHLNALRTVGATEWFDYFDAQNGTYTSAVKTPNGVDPHSLYPWPRNTIIDRIAKNTRVYAKKQLAWLPQFNGLRYVDTVNDILRLMH